MHISSRLAYRAILVAAVVCCAACAPALAGTKIWILDSSTNPQTLQQSISLAAPQPIVIEWVTTESGATGGIWRVTNNVNTKVVTGSAGQAPKPGGYARFKIPAKGAGAFLDAAGTNSPVKFSLTVTATDGAKKPLGAPSLPVVVTEVQAAPVTFGPQANYPVAQLVSYTESIGTVPETEIQYATAVVKVMLVNQNDAPTSPIWLGVSDFNALMRQTKPVAIPVLSKKGSTFTATVNMSAVLPPAQSQTPDAQQYAYWQKQYDTICGVDLRADLDWRGPQSQAPMNDHQESYLYLGYHDSKPWQAGPGPSNVSTCDATTCISLAQMARSLYRQLACKTVGYAYFIGRDAQHGVFNAFGSARTSANPPQVDYTPWTKMEVGSVSKMVTTFAALRAIDSHQIDIGSPFYTELPQDWRPKLAPFVKTITFRWLLSQDSRIKNYGNFDNDYAGLETFFTQPVNPGSRTKCQGAAVQAITGQINPNDPAPCYSNFNFAIFRVLIPAIEGLPVDNNQATRPTTLANQYVQTAQKLVFDPVGRADVECSPPTGEAAGTYSYAYEFPGSLTGFDWGDTRLGCGAAAWYLSVEDMAAVLLSVNNGDGKVLSPAEYAETETMHLGWDKVIENDTYFGGKSPSGPRELEKNGGWSACAGKSDSKGNCLSDSVALSTSVAIFGGSATTPGLVGVLFINQAPGNAEGALEQAYYDNAAPKP